MNIIPVHSNDVSIPMTISTSSIVYNGYYNVWHDYLSGTLTELTDDTLPPDIVILGDSVFRNYSSLTSVELENIIEVGTYCFYYSSINNLVLPNLQKAGNYSFAYIPVESVEFPNVTELRPSAFYYCSNLQNASFNKAVLFGNQVFYNCRELDSLTLSSNTMSTLASSNALLGTKIASGEGSIYVPESLIEQYQNAPGWSTYADRFQAL